MFNNCTTGFTMPVAPVSYGTGYNNGGLFGGNDSWLGLIVILALLGGWGGNGGFGFGGFGGGGRGFGFGEPWATQADVRAAVDQQTLISKIDQQTYGIADTFTALNNTLNNNFRGIDNAICTLGYQAQQGFSGLSAQLANCCCDIERGIERDTTQGIMNTNAIQKQISDCCCNLEKMNMQNRFDAQAYNCNTLQAIDKLGDRIIDYMNCEKTQALRDENQALRLAASQAAQNQFLVSELRPVAKPSYLTCSPFQSAFGFNNGFGFNNCGCGCGCGCN